MSKHNRSNTGSINIEAGIPTDPAVALSTLETMLDTLAVISANPSAPDVVPAGATEHVVGDPIIKDNSNTVLTADQEEILRLKQALAAAQAKPGFGKTPTINPFASSKDFMDRAQAQGTTRLHKKTGVYEKGVIDVPVNFTMVPAVFSTGSYGYKGNAKITVKVGDREVVFQANLNLVVPNSGSK